jgi:hypothetical protein
VRGVLATLDAGVPGGARALSLAPEGEAFGAYLSDRVRLGAKLTAELGLRWDKQTWLPPDADRQFSPRASLLYRLGARGDLRFSIGRYFQPERILELQVEDGIVSFSPAQNGSHAIAAFEHGFDAGVKLRVEWFRKWTKRVRPRYENLFDPYVLLPELRPGRVEIAADRAESRGVEAVLEGTEPIAWWVALSVARASDIVDGRSVPRSWDQRRAFTGGATFDVGAWDLSVAATYHTGWPATGLSIATVGLPGGGSADVAVAGSRNAERLEGLRRIDLRAERRLEIAVGVLDFFTEITNATGRRNPCCVRYTPVVSDGAVELERSERPGLPLLVNLGVLWQF